ncbi:retron-type reverse transcriptase [Psychroflexus torquis ATCC 700755]|uniref:Retron-type reverse transcriptase n=1 Tax=Psychroflexus torquis (strain ATCC 700755 / CIP 106069 / ACAM 623) TaxID=313595 RepID=K4IWU5_PSYTT|nr:group II intron reverse transcriptase/maturase [Psychroflexus torquis]AFU69930.1 retron-type reverse transcriptase [Psychroflexus torquis ATCC 700755]
MKDIMTSIDVNLLTSPSQSDAAIRVFQRKLYIRAKQDKGFKAYSLYGKLCEDHTLIEAYRRVRSNYSKGVGVDNQSSDAIEKQGISVFLGEIQQDLQGHTYRSQAVKQKLIPKEKEGDFRVLGIPTIRDRVVQMAVKMLIEPLWEADFEHTSFGFRPKRGAKDAIKQVKQNIYDRHQFVYDADLSKYFDTIPHTKLFILLKKRLVDHSILSLIHQWLTAPVRLPNGKLVASTKGSPQGGVISPLLSNIYLHAFDQIVNNPKGKFAKANIRIVRYADDFLLMGKWYFSKEILDYITSIMDNMGLTLNKEKTKLLHSSKSSLFFLGFEFRSIKSKFGWNAKNYTNVRPSMKSRSKLFSKLRELFANRKHWTIEWIVWKVNQLLRGWLNYFSISKVTHIWETIKIIKKHLDYKLFKWMKCKGRKAHRKLRQRPYENLVKFYNLFDIEKYARLKTLAKAQ